MLISSNKNTDWIEVDFSPWNPKMEEIREVFSLLKKADSFRISFNILNLIIWLIGFVLYRILMHVDTPVGNTLPDMVITIIICLIVNAVCKAVSKQK